MEIVSNPYMEDAVFGRNSIKSVTVLALMGRIVAIGTELAGVFVTNNCPGARVSIFHSIYLLIHGFHKNGRLDNAVDK